MVDSWRDGSSTYAGVIECFESIGAELDVLDAKSLFAPFRHTSAAMSVPSKLLDRLLSDSMRLTFGETFVGEVVVRDRWGVGLLGLSLLCGER